MDWRLETVMMARPNRRKAQRTIPVGQASVPAKRWKFIFIELIVVG